MKPCKQISVLVLLIFSLFYGCKKNDFRDPAQRCHILETADRIFTYNAYGNPVAFTYKENPDWTGNPTFNFVYDSRQRLTDYGGFIGHHITYNSQGRAIIDSIISNYAGHDTRYAERLFYDYFGRINKVISTMYRQQGIDLPLPYTVEVSYYNYDKRGNLITRDAATGGFLTYDNKTNICRTNPIFMLIQRNYSINNPSSDANYNAAGLPDIFNGGFLEGGATGIIYSCSGNINK
jgi:hypothetical protein